MKLSPANKTTLFIHLHKSIEEAATETANHIIQGRYNDLINYPPNGGLTENEIRSLEELRGKEDLKSALRKILASTTADVFFDIFNIIDGTVDPDPASHQWTELMLVDKPADFDDQAEFLHDDFFSTYWDWKEKRKNTNWSLDNL
jgi:hypothetical protein